MVLTTRTGTPLFLILLFIFITQCTDDRLFNRLTVVNGNGSGIYELGQSILIEADTPAVGMGFSRWIGDTAWLENPASPATSCTMPLHDIVLTAMYAPLPTYLLQVENGLGAGRYLAGTPVNVRAIPPADTLSFKIWEGDILYLRDEEDENTVLTMPEKDVSIRALFEPNNLVSFQRDVLPVIALRCHNCHGEDDIDPYTTYQEIASNSNDIRSSLETDFMPPGNPIPLVEKLLIYKWIDQGKKNN